MIGRRLSGGLLWAVLLAATPAQAILQVHFIGFGPDEERLDGVLVTVPYTFEVFVSGTDIADVCLTPLGHANCIPLSTDGPGWSIDPTDPIHTVPPVVEFPMLEALRAVYPVGDYVFSFNEQTPGVYESVITIPQLVDPPGFLQITSPAHQETDVDHLSPVFTWTCPASGDFIRVELQIGEEDGPSVDLSFCQTSWTPGSSLTPMTQYQFTGSNFFRTGGIGGQSLAGPNGSMITVDDEAEALNVVIFTTAARPVPTLGGAGVLLGILLIAVTGLAASRV